MLRDDVEARLRETQGRDGYLFPAYESYCVGNVPDSVRALFDVSARRPLPADVMSEQTAAVRRVVLIVIDGFGLDAWRRDRSRHRFLETLSDRAVVTPLTSIYPSETAAAITTLETGQLPVDHGRIGWNVYDPRSDRAFLALDGQVKVDPAGGAVRTDEAFEGLEYLYPALADAGVDCHRLQPFEGRSPGVSIHGYDRLDEFGSQLADIVLGSDDPAYVYGYVPDIDHVAHAVGTEAPAYRKTVVAVGEQLETFVAGLDDRTAEETLMLVMADHGHVNTQPDRNVDLAENETVMANLRRHADGSPVRLAGSPRNVHLHLRDGTVSATRDALSGLDARVFTRDQALTQGLFGDRPASERFQRRCGDLVLTHRHLGTWFGDLEPDNLELVGMHGGLHPDEMLVPFAAVLADRLPSG